MSKSFKDVELKIILQSIIEGIQLIEESMVKTIQEKIDYQIIIYLGTYGSIIHYFAVDSWTTRITTMKRRYSCKTFDKLILS